VDRSTPVGPALSSNLANGFGEGRVTVGIQADGSLLALHRPLPADNLILSRFDAAADAWVAASPVVNDRPLGLSNMATFGLDGSDVPHVAFVQPRASDSTLFELVLKRLVNGAWENAAPVLPLLGARPGDMSPGEMLFDLANRPVISFLDPNLSRLQVIRLDSGVLSPLGTPFPQLLMNPSLKMRVDGTLVVSYVRPDGAGGTVLTAALFNGSSWTGLPNVDAAPLFEFINSPRPAVVGDELWIGYDRVGGANAGVNVKRFDGTTWVSVPFDPPLASGAGAVDLDLIGNRPALATLRGDGTTLVLRHDGTAWSDQFDATGATAQPTIRFAARGGSVLLVASNRGINQALVQRLTFP
jgi:hypothetical protein